MKSNLLFHTGIATMAFVISCSSGQPYKEAQNLRPLAPQNDTSVHGEKALTLDETLNSLSSQISSRMSEGHKQKIAVIEFSDLDGRVTAFGKFLSEELITRLSTSRKFEVVERQLLDKILAEHKLHATGVVDESTAKELGRILGVDAICTGTFIELSSSVRINARLMSTETALIFDAAAVQIQKTEDVKILINTDSRSIAQKADPSTVIKKDNLPSVFYKEDFSEVPDGLLPKGWSGGEKMGVKSEGGKKFLSDLIQGDFQNKIFIDNIQFPENFELELYFHFGDFSYYAKTILSIEQVKVTFNQGGHFTLGPCSSNRAINLSNTDLWLKIWKQGPVVKLFVDGEEYLLCRLPDFQKPKTILMEFSRQSYIKLFRITGQKLE